MATYYAIHAGGNFSAGGTWSTVATKSVARVGGAVAPTNADTCILDDYSGSVTVDTTTCVCKILDCAGNGNYTNTLTYTSGQTLTVSGNVTYSTAMTTSGTGTLAVNATSAMTSGGITHSGSILFNNASTKTLSGGWLVTGNVSFTTGASVLNGSTLQCANLTLTGVAVSGTTVISVGGIWSASNSSSKLSNSTTLLSGSTISGAVYYGTGTLTNTSGVGTVTTAGSTLNIVANCSLSLSTLHLVILKNSDFSGYTITLLSDLYVDTDITNASSGSLAFNGASFYVYAAGSVSLSGTISGTTAGLYLNGTGNLGGALGNTTITCNLIINTAGTITFAQIILYNTGIFTYTAGTVVTTGNNFVLGTATLNVSGIGFNTITPNSSASITLLSNLNSINWMQGAGTVTFSGNFNLNLQNFSQTQTGASIALAAGTSLNISTSIIMVGVSGGTSIVSATPNSPIYLNYTGTMANVQIFQGTFTDVDATNSTVPIYSWYGTVTRSVNVFAVTGSNIGGGGVSVTNY